MVWRADGDERAHACREPEVRERVARIEAAHTVRDHVDAIVRQRFDRRDEQLRASGYRRDRRKSHGVHVTAERFEMPRDAAEVIEAHAGDADAIETEEAVDEDDR